MTVNQGYAMSVFKNTRGKV